jgi:hypothetical protein
MEEITKSTGMLSKLLIGFLVLSTLVVIYLSIKLIVLSTTVRDM